MAFQPLIYLLPLTHGTSNTHTTHIYHSKSELRPITKLAFIMLQRIGIYFTPLAPFTPPFIPPLSENMFWSYDTVFMPISRLRFTAS